MLEKESKKKIVEMLSLVERMDKHCTKNESSILLENKMIKEGLNDRSNVAIVDNVAHSINNPEELIKIMSKEDMTPSKGWYVTLGYVEGFSKLGKKKISNNIDPANITDDLKTRLKGLGHDRINKIIDNPQIIDKGRSKGNVRNPYMPDSYSNYIVRVDKIRLMYGRNEEYGKQKDAVKQDLAKYQQEHPDEVQYYMDNNSMIDFASQSYDDARATTKRKIPNTNVYQYDDNSYEFNFNTPKSVYSRLKTSYFLITDENNIEEISESEAQAYAELFGVEETHKTQNDAIIKQVEDAIKDIKTRHHGGDIWTKYKLDSIFLLNFASEEGNQKLQYYNPNAIVRFVKGRELKSGTVPSRYTTPGVFKSHLEKMKQ